MRILVVDDHPLIRAGVRGMLARHDQACDVAEADDCGSAIALLGNGGDTPDLILLDLSLPDCGGLAALEAVRAAAPSSTPPPAARWGTSPRPWILIWCGWRWE
jgi:DNA-binding NarL/FixJ family response regulator